MSVNKIKFIKQISDGNKEEFTYTDFTGTLDRDHDDVVLEIIKIEEDSSKWRGKKQENFKPDKDAWVLSEFRKEFTNVKVDSIMDVTNLVNRSSGLKKWYAAKSFAYVETINIPQYFKDYVTQEAWKDASNKAEALSQILNDDAKAKKELSEKYYEDLENIEKETNINKNKIIGGNRVMYIANLSSEKMPISIQKSIEDWTPKTADAPTKKAYAREALINYKISLLKILKARPNIDIEHFVESRLFS